MAKKRKTKRKFPPQNLTCPFGKKPEKIDYKDVHTLKKYITTRGRILPSSRTGVSPRCQRKLALSIKRARYMALLPYNQII
ncbi:30S ribosomal protein S18 [Candidatus Dojkabacteria bacterium]|uniref:Small ribosomal subunit protein bS18 n=1 Tax=Candidatus Dojkabacteria bacterium TaxID=2099670 RepID=A0A955L9E8_9BACT|nr:30S ribosomal protein S18 [Candidatus Dojkabacteria bacterium]